MHDVIPEIPVAESQSQMKNEVWAEVYWYLGIVFAGSPFREGFKAHRFVTETDSCTSDQISQPNSTQPNYPQQTLSAKAHVQVVDGPQHVAHTAWLLQSLGRFWQVITMSLS